MRRPAARCFRRLPARRRSFPAPSGQRRGWRTAQRSAAPPALKCTARRHAQSASLRAHTARPLSSRRASLASRRRLAPDATPGFGDAPTNASLASFFSSSLFVSASCCRVGAAAQDQGQARGATRRPLRRTIPGGRLQTGDDREARRSTFASTATGGQRRLPPPRQQAVGAPAARGLAAQRWRRRYCAVVRSPSLPRHSARSFSHAPSSSADSRHPRGSARENTPQLLPTRNSARRLGA